MFDIIEIKKILPHRYPMLMLDRITEYVPGERLTGVKNVTHNEPFFAGHFPDEPIMPGVLILEALAQLASFFVLKEQNLPLRITLFTRAEDVSFRRKVFPGDQLKFEGEGLRFRFPHGSMKMKASVGGEIAAEATVKFMIQGPKE